MTHCMYMSGNLSRAPQSIAPARLSTNQSIVQTWTIREISLVENHCSFLLLFLLSLRAREKNMLILFHEVASEICRLYLIIQIFPHWDIVICNCHTQILEMSARNRGLLHNFSIKREERGLVVSELLLK